MKYANIFVELFTKTRFWANGRNGMTPSIWSQNGSQDTTNITVTPNSMLTIFNCSISFCLSWLHVDFIEMKCFKMKWNVLFIIVWPFPIKGQPQLAYDPLLFTFTYTYMSVGTSPKPHPPYPGIEPGPLGWESPFLTIRLFRRDILEAGAQYYYLGFLFFIALELALV